MSTLTQDAPGVAPAIGAASDFRTLIVHVEPDETARPRLDSAVALARKLDAMLIGVGAEDNPPLGVYDPYGMLDAQWEVEMQRISNERLAEAEALFRRQSAGLRVEWARCQAAPAGVIERLSREADLIIAGGVVGGPEGSLKRCNPADLVMKSGRPVLIVPAMGGGLKAEAVVVGWKDTREARRALADARPFLAAARTVVLFEAVADDERLREAQERLQAVAAGLARHGIRSEIRAVVAPDHEVAAELDLAAARVGADLLVIGGYSHTRLGEWVFGGVTRDLMQPQDRFVLMSH